MAKLNFDEKELLYIREIIVNSNVRILIGDAKFITSIIDKIEKSLEKEKAIREIERKKKELPPKNDSSL